jgi:ribonuclease VapC
VIIDTSALVAVLRDEPDAEAYLEAIRSTVSRRLSAGSYLELGIVIDRPSDPISSRRLDDVLSRMLITIEPVTASQARTAREAYRDFGKGRHRAGLNFGDCFSYALARELNEPLLFKGDAFVHTDIPLVGRPSDRHRLNEALARYTVPSDDSMGRS